MNIPHLHFLNATWTDSTDPNSVSVNVYRATVSGGPYTLIANVPMGVQFYQDTSALVGVQYFYVTTELDNGNPPNESTPTLEQIGFISG